MGLKMIIGASGTGKSEYLYNLISDEATVNKSKRYFVIVPDQFTMQTQLDMVRLSPGKGIMNIDVLSFSRLAHRIFEETNAVNVQVLDDTGKSLVLRKLVADISGDVPYLAGNIKRNGFIHEVKSSISEFMQYGISTDDLRNLISYSEGKGALKAKLTDLSVLYERFQEYIKDSYITTEESMDLLARELTKSTIIKDSVVVFDGFTGFTPVQMKVLGVLMNLCERVYVTLTLEEEKTGCSDIPQELFSFTAKSYMSLMRLAKELNVSVDVDSHFTKNYRFENKPDLLYLERNIFRNQPKGACYDKLPERINLYEADSLQSEAGIVAGKIRELVTSGVMYRDIAVVTGGLGDYENHIVREFRKYSIPVYLDKTSAIVLNPIVEFTKSLFQMVKRNFSVEDVCRFLRTGIGRFDVEEVDIFENYCIRTGFKGKKKYQNFGSFAKEKSNDLINPLTPEQLAELEVVGKVVSRILEIISPLFERDITARKAQKVSDYVEALYKCYLKVDAYDVLSEYAEMFRDEGDYTREKEYSQIYRLTMELLEQLHGLLGSEAMELEEFMDILEAGFEEITVGTIPQSVDKVIVGDIERSRLKPVKYLFFMGLNDGNIPKKGGKASILSEMEREYLAGNEFDLELSPTPHQKMFIQRFYLYNNLVKPSEGLILSYSNLDSSGKGLRPAYIVPMLYRMFPKLEAHKDTNKGDISSIGNLDNLKEFICDQIRRHGEKGLSSDEYGDLMVAIEVLLKMDNGYTELLNLFVENSFYRYKDKKLDGIIAGILYGENLLASISRMEKYAECAYSYFLRYGLSLKERELYSVDNRDLGTIFHEVMKQYGETLAREGKSWLDVSKEEAAEIIDRELRNYCTERKEIFFDNKANEYIYRRMAKVLYKAVDVLSYQLSVGKYRVNDLEVAFSRHQVLDEINPAFSVQEQMELNGRIDRIDTMDMEGKVYVKVIDYKTGDKDFSLVNFYQGTQLQLVVYLSEALKTIKRKNKGKDVVPGALLYYQLADKTVKASQTEDEETINSKIRESLKTKGLLNDDELNLLGLTGQLSGKSDVVPVAFNKSGEISKTSSVMDVEGLQLLQEFAKYKLRNIGDDIITGKITCNPIKEGEERNSCMYCGYRKVCGFEERLDGYAMRTLIEESDDIILEKMKQDMET